MIIAIEGIDGAGKNTFATALEAELIDNEIPVARVAFPRYEESIHAQLAQQALYGHMGDTIDSACAMATLFALDRGEVAQELASLSDDGYVVIIDRFVASNAAYTSARTNGVVPNSDDLDTVTWVTELEFEQLGIPYPDLQILVNTDTELAALRAYGREAEDQTRTRDHYEKDRDLQATTLQAYQSLARDNWVSPWIVASSEDVSNGAWLEELVAEIISNLGD